MDIEDVKLDCGVPDATEQGLTASDSGCNEQQRVDRVIVQIKAGMLSGIIERLPGEGNMYVFKGIPYAQAPVGELRFKPPRRIENLPNGILDCSQDGPGCYSIGSHLPNDHMSESCLSLNVYSPALPNYANDTSNPLPVMVWIHGGGFVGGSAHSSMYNPKPLVQEGVIVVTVNYRLGPLGFLCLPSVGIYGNMGLKDQRMAFCWIKENISKFGGDPDNITIFGQSAGGSSVHLHYLSEISRQYFCKAIAQSGTAFNQWVLQKSPEDHARKLAHLLGCSFMDDDNAIYDTLMHASPEKMTEMQYAVMSDRERNVLVNFPFTPVVETSDSNDPVILEDPLNLIKKKSSKRIPLIMGITNEEGAGLASHVIENMDKYRRSIDDQLVPFILWNDNQNDPTVCQEVKMFFFGNEHLTLNTVPIMIQILGDNANKYAGYQSAELHARFQKSPLFFYIFSHVTDLNKTRQLAKTPKNCPGAVHGDDLWYLFQSTSLDTESVSMQAKVYRKSMSQLWTNFAKTGSPVGNCNIEWPAVSVVEDDNDCFVLNAYEICETPSVVSNPFAKRFNFWKTLMKKYDKTKQNYE